MYLKRLEIGGFKSFASKSVLDFEQGKHVAAIVGPNGSGKSNVADAIRWVLGEQSYKTLRSKKSEDVIFSGSTAKSKGSYARVAMLLDNSDGKAPIDFTEVEISRSVFRDGSSEYMLNGKKARLLDVAELLAKSGFGQSTYSVIGQGMVDSMLFYGPAERKVLFDEAAGVRQYEIKREQTLRKLEDTNGNIIRIKDILSELNPRLSTLRRQAERAKEKDAIKGSLLDKQKIYFSTIWDRFNYQDQEKRKDLEKITAEETKLETEIAELNKKFNEILGKERVRGDETKNLQQKISGLEKQKDEIRQKIFTLRAKIEVSFSADKLTKKEIDGRIAEAEKRLAQVDFSALTKEKSTVESEIAALEGKELNQTVKEIEGKKDELRQEIYTLRAKMAMVASPNSLSRTEIDHKISLLEGELNELRVSEIEKTQGSLKQKIEKIVLEEERLQARVAEKRQMIQALSEEIASFDFGTVGQELNSILESQNIFLIQVEAARDIKDLAQTIEIGREVSGSIEKLLGKVGSAKEGKISGMGEIQGEIEALVKEKEALVNEKNDLKNELVRLGYELTRSQSRRQEIKAEIERLKELKPVDKADIKRIEQEVAVYEKQVSGLDSEIEKIRTEMGGINALRSRQMNVDFEIKREESKKAEIESELARLKALKPIDLTEKVQLEKEIDGYNAEIAELDKEISGLRIEINQKAGDYDSQSKILSEIKDSLYSKQNLLSRFTQEVANLRVELAKIDTKKQDVKEEIVRDLGSEAVLADAKVVPELVEGIARTEIEKLKSKLYAIGEIDSEVECEFKEVSERVEFMTTQVDDLDQAKKDLEKLVGELDIKIKKQFESSFSSISAKFSHFFELLFGGGTAKLELVRQKDEEEETERFGIEITAVPPGKRVKSLSALSGGERTLTSLALLFAILSVNPAPFCVLDEVDAALDETNTKKFLKIVSELITKTQFIFISHNRETMKAASMIYGITMDETHASKLLSIKLEDALVSEKKKPVAV